MKFEFVVTHFGLLKTKFLTEWYHIFSVFSLKDGFSSSTRAVRLPRSLYDPLFHVKLGECSKLSGQARRCFYCIISKSRLVIDLLFFIFFCCCCFFTCYFSEVQPLFSLSPLGNTWVSYIIDLLYFGQTSMYLHERVANLEIAIPGPLTGKTFWVYLQICFLF